MSTAFGHFQLLELLGTGGMAEVFRAEMRREDGFIREVVVKRMLPELTSDRDTVAMFVHEARLAARLVHPHIVPVFDFGKIDGRHYLVMELVRGCDLAKLLAAIDGPLPVGATIALVSALLDALDHAHTLTDEDGQRVGLVHRDVSPANVLLGMNGEIKLTDFGIARTRAQLPRTTVGQVRGKVPYMSPEQASGQALDSRSDLFSIGVLLYEALVGVRPFRADDTDALITKIRSGTFERPTDRNPALPAALGAVVERALAVSPDARYQSARELDAALLEAAAAADVRPDEAALAALVAPIATERKERGPATAVERPRRKTPQAATSSVPGDRSGVRQLAFVIALVLLCATVAGAVSLYVLRAGSGRQPVLRVALRMYPVQRDWFRREVFDPFERAHGCKIDVSEYNETTDLYPLLANGEADLAKVDYEHAPLLVERGLLRRLSDLGARVDAAAYAELAHALRPEAVQLGTFTTVVGEDLFLGARKLETEIFVYRRSLVEQAVAAFPRQRAALDARLRAVRGQGLPAGFTLAADPSRWTSWDLLAASWVWAVEPYQGHVRPRYVLNMQQVIPLVIAGGADPAAWRRSPVLIDLLELWALLRELELLDPSALDPAHSWKATVPGFQHGEIAAFISQQISIAVVSGLGGFPGRLDDPRDLGFSTIPRPVRLVTPAPVANDTPPAMLFGWGWGVARNAHEPELAMKLLLEILSRSRHQAEVDTFPILSVRTDVRATTEPGRSLQALADAQLRPDHARIVPMPKVPARLEEDRARLASLLHALLVDRAYGAPGHVERDAIERLVARELGGP